MAKKIKEDLKEQAEVVKKKFKSMGVVKLILLALLAVGTVLSFVFYDYIFGTNTVFTVDYGKGFYNGVMSIIPKVIRCLQIITITSIVATILLFIISHTFVKSQRSITVSRLICNLIRWVVVIALIIVVLAVWGVNTTALITGAGVITLIVGLGMQSLIADIVAGLFIVFENEFNIGDIITVDGFRGEVISMGIRTTKLKAAGNIKIFNNSEIKGVLNQTVEPSTAKAYIDIEYGASLANVETVIKEKLKDVKVDGVIGEICYEGVNELGASGVTLYFSAQCYEGDIFAVQRAMNAKLKNMFDENGISIPFPQIVVHTEN